MADRVYNRPLFVIAEFRVDRESKNLTSGGFADREVAGVISQPGERHLLMERDGIVDFACDVAAGEVLPELISPLSTDHILMEDMGSARISKWKDDLVGRLR